MTSQDPECFILPATDAVAVFQEDLQAVVLMLYHTRTSARLAGDDVCADIADQAGHWLIEFGELFGSIWPPSAEVQERCRERIRHATEESRRAAVDTALREAGLWLGNG